MVNHPNRRRKVATTHDHEHDYSALLEGVRTSFSAVSGPLFRTEADGLNALYLDSLPAERQVHDCSCCKRFIHTFGNLVSIGEDGETIPAMWNPDAVPEFYQPAFKALFDKVRKARVKSVFLTKQTEWGISNTGKWSHIAVQPAASMIYRERAMTAGQAMAAAKESFRTVSSALADFTPQALDEALRLLRADMLARSEKFIGPVQWLRALHDRPKGRKGENVLWRAIATAPEGYCHPRASVVGALLEDIAAGMAFDDIKARFNAKLGPLIYQRPQAAPAAGAIKAAEELVAKLGLAPSLERRYARLDDLQCSWVPKHRDTVKPAGGVFGHIKPKDSDAVRSVDMPAVTMTWDKFTRTVLPDTERLEISVPSHGRFIGLTTAASADALPILKWDRPDERNPVAWYVYHNGSPASQWGIAPGWAPVSAITPLPTLWGSRPSPFMGEGVILIIEGAADMRTDSGNALFPECLRDDLHGIRSVVEAYSRTATLGPRDGAVAGYDIRKSSAYCLLRAFVAGAWNTYRIDRWD